MVHGEEKAREMARSLLPSTRRVIVRREKATIHRAHRRHFRGQMRQLAREPEDFEDRADLEDEPVTEIRWVMRGRRSADKIPPFLRWATARALPMPRDSRLSHIRALVPRGLIGDHALSHLQHEELFKSSAQLAFERERAAHRPRPYLMNRGEQAEWLRALLRAPEGHRVFNQWLKVRHLLEHHEKLKGWHCTCEPQCRRLPWALREALPPVRLLQGAHDVLPFLADIWDPKDVTRWSGRRSTPLDSIRSGVDTFLRTFKKHRGDVVATARTLGLAPRPLD